MTLRQTRDEISSPQHAADNRMTTHEILGHNIASGHNDDNGPDNERRGR